MTTAQQQLVEQHMDYAQALAREISKKLPRQVDFDELSGYARLGLSQAASEFNPTMGTAFTTFSYYRIRGAVFDGLRKMTWLSPRQRARVQSDALANEANAFAANIPPADDSIESIARRVDSAIVQTASVFLLGSVAETDRPIEPIDEQTPDQGSQNAEIKRLLLDMLATLSPEDREVIELMYFKDQSMTEIAATKGVNKATICRKHAKILELLRQRLGGIEEN